MSPSHRGSRGKNRRNHNQPARSHVTEHLSPMPGFPIYPGAFGGLTANNIPMDPLVQGSANQPRSVVMHQPRPTTQPLGVGRGNTFPGPGSQHVVYHERPNDSVYQTFNGTGRGQTQMYNDLHPYAGAMQQHQPQPHLTVGNGWMDIPSPSNDRRRHFDTPRRFSPSDKPQGRDLVTMTRQEFNRTTQSLQELRKENSNMHRELNELRHFRKETLKHQKSAEDTRKSSAVSQENDLAFRKLLEEKLPTRKERSRSRRPTFPGSSAPALNLFSGYEKKQFSKGTLLGTNNKLKMTQTAGNVQDTATLSNAQVVGAAHNRGRQPIRESVFPTRSRGTSDTGKVSYAAAVAGRDSRKTKSDSGVISSGESSPTEWPSVSKAYKPANGSQDGIRSRSKKRIARRRSQEPKVERNTSSSSASDVDAIKEYNGPLIVDGSGRTTSDDVPQAADASKTFSFNPCANDFNFGQRLPYEMDNSGNYQWSYGYQGQDYSQEEIGFEYQRPSYYSPSKNGYEFGGSQYQGPEYQGNTIEPPYHHESLQQGHQYMSNMPQLEQHYSPSGIPDGAHYMTQGPAQEHYEYDPGQSELFRDQTVDYENNSSHQTAPPVREMCVEETGAFNNPIYESEQQPSVSDTTFVIAEIEATPLHQSEASVSASAVVIAEVEENSLHQSTPFVGNSAIIAAEFEATLLHQPEAKAATKNPILVSPKVVESRRFNWADDSSEEDTLVDELQSATGESVAMTNPQTSEKLEIDNEDNTDAKHNVPTKALVEVKPTSDWSASGVSATTANNQSEDRVRVESVATADIGNQKHPLATSKQEISPVFDTEELPATEETATAHRQTAPQDDNISGPQTREIVDSTVNETVIARHESASQDDHVSVPKSSVMVTGAANETATTQHKTTQYETTTQDGHEPVPASHTTILFAVGEIPAVHSPVLAVPLVENELPKAETEENPWQTVERSAKYGRQPKLRKVYGSGAITSGRKPSSGSSWASIVSVPTAPVTPTKKTDLALDVQQKLESPGPVTAGVQQNVIRPEAKRKLYISDIPKETTYADLLHGIKGGLIDDIYLSSQSPDRHQHHQLKTGRPRSEKNDPCFAYITFYSEEGAQRCVQYLRHIDAAQGSTVSTSSKKQANTYTSMHKPVAHITLSGHRTPVYCREKDQRILQRDVVEAVQSHHGTRVLIFTFRKNIRIKLPHTGNSSTWDIWQKALSRDNGTPGLELIQRHIQVWRNTPKIDVESIELLPTITEAPATKKPSTVPKLFLGAPADQTFRVRVSLIRISVAQKVKQILEQDIMFREHCSISFAPDPCAEEFTIPEPITVPETSNTIQGDTTSGSTPGTPTKLRKKKKKAAALKIGVGVEDSEAFPPLPRSASFKTSDEMKTPTSVTLWTSKELPLAVRTRDSSVVKETEETEKPADNAEDDETKSVTSSHRSVSSTCRTIPIFGDIEAIDTGKEEGTVDMPANRKGK